MKLGQRGNGAEAFVFGMFVGAFVMVIVFVMLNKNEPTCKIISSGTYEKVDYLRGGGCSGEDQTIITWRGGSTVVLHDIVPVDMKAGEEYSVVRYNNENPKFELSEKACILDLRAE